MRRSLRLERLTTTRPIFDRRRSSPFRQCPSTCPAWRVSSSELGEGASTSPSPTSALPSSNYEQRLRNHRAKALSFDGEWTVSTRSFLPRFGCPKSESVFRSCRSLISSPTGEEDSRPPLRSSGGIRGLGGAARKGGGREQVRASA